MLPHWPEAEAKMVKLSEPLIHAAFQGGILWDTAAGMSSPEYEKWLASLSEAAQLRSRTSHERA